MSHHHHALIWVCRQPHCLCYICSSRCRNIRSVADDSINLQLSGLFKHLLFVNRADVIVFISILVRRIIRKIINVYYMIPKLLCRQDCGFLEDISSQHHNFLCHLIQTAF